MVKKSNIPRKRHLEVQCGLDTNAISTCWSRRQAAELLHGKLWTALPNGAKCLYRSWPEQTDLIRLAL